MRKLLFASAVAGTTVLCGDVRCRFAPGGWQPSDWVMVRSPRWSHKGGWVQEDDAIRNATPADATKAEMLGKRAGQTYTSMVLKGKSRTNLEVRATMSYEHRMAPLVVLAPVLGKAEDGTAEYREHWEVVLFDQGINIWHHTYADGKPSWHKAAFSRFTTEPGVEYSMTVTIKPARGGTQITVLVGDHEFGYLEPDLPEAFHVGLTGCEGVNRFHSFGLKQLD